jgi:molecular chaperone DnaK
MDWVCEEFESQSGVDIRQDKMAMQRVRDSSEKAKCELSTTLETTINLPFLAADDSGPKHLELTLTRAKLENLVEPLIRKTIDPCRQALHDAGISTTQIEKVIVVGGMTRMPAVRESVKKFFNQEAQKGVDPDEVVAKGAAIQAGVLTGVVEEVILLDVTPLSLGIETLGGVMTKLIARNTTVPTRKTQIFSTASDNQPAVSVHVLQGERELSRDNRTLGRFDLVGLPPAPRGVPQIEVTFDIDANGIVKVSAKDLGTGRQQEIAIKVASGLSEKEIERMVEDAVTHAEDDKKKREVQEVVNQADILLYSTEATLKDFAERFSEPDLEQIKAAIVDVRAARNAEERDLEAIRQATAALQTIMHRFAELMYSAPDSGNFS